MKQGLLSIKVPVRIGLTKCFDEICEKQDGIENFLHIQVPTLSPTHFPSRSPTLATAESSTIPTTTPTNPGTTDNALQSSMSWIPKNVKNTLDGKLKDEKKVIGTYLHPFKLASIVSIPLLLLSTACSICVLLIFAGRCASFAGRFVLGVHKSPRLPISTLSTLLLIGAGLLSLSSLVYTLITSFYLNGGEYSQGVGFPLCSGVIGGMCALFVLHDSDDYRNEVEYRPVPSRDGLGNTMEMEDRVRYKSYGSTYPT
ncbi:hypothetical protein EON65_17345 [archaeon]|nr:MAG: hypothetical protein EON65_17345 [archaeon]